MAESKYKLMYFNTKGLCEFIRLIFHYAGVDFEDIRISKSEWPALKEKQPYGTLPVLEVDGQILNQSVAIARFLGKRFGLTQNDPIKEALLDAVVDNFTDLREKMRKAYSEKTPEASQQSEEAKKYVFDKFESLVTEGFFYGSKPTWVDIYFTGMMETMEDYYEDPLKDHPKLKALCNKIKSNNRIQEYIKNRPVSELQ